MARIIILIHSIFLSALVLLLFTLIFPIPAHTETFNVKNEDELREALSTAESNGEDDVINIAAGRYRTFGEPFTYETNEGFSLTIKGKGVKKTKLDGDGLSRVLTIESVLGNPESSQFPVTLESLTIQQGNNQSMGNFFDEQAGGLFINNADSVTINQCMFIDNSTLGDGGGVYILDANTLYLHDNEFYSNMSGGSGGGLYGRFYGHEVSIVSIINNIFAKNISLSEYPEAGAISISDAENLNIINNTIVLNSSGPGSSALILEIPYGQYEGIEHIANIYNNIVIQNDISEGSDILVRLHPFPVPTNLPTGFPGPVTIDYGTVNLFNNDVAVFEVEESGGCGYSEVTCLLNVNQDNNIIADPPLFVNAEAGNFNLLFDSPCVDSGDPNAPDVPNTDIYGNPRSPIPDMGAVEYIAEAANNGGCSLTGSAAASTLSVFLALPILMLMRRLVKRDRK